MATYNLNILINLKYIMYITILNSTNVLTKKVVFMEGLGIGGNKYTWTPKYKRGLSPVENYMVNKPLRQGFYWIKVKKAGHSTHVMKIIISFINT